MNEQAALALPEKQKRVLIGVAGGFVYALAVFWTGGWLVEVAPVPAADRLAFALPWLMVPALALSLAFARLAFWWGYRRTPTGRAFGMAATLWPTVLAYPWALKLAFPG